MHGLACALAEAGHQVTGSDDKIYNPARSRLMEAGILPEEEGWHPERITEKLDAVILGMHAYEDNPELARALELKVPIYSFPEFIHRMSENKQRIVIAGSYGKTTVTSMIMHVLESVGKKFDFVVGAAIDGFKYNVRLSEDAPLIVIEGDEYLSSRLDKQPKFLRYRGHVVLLNGMAWDHINVFPSEEVYINQFEQLVKRLGKAADVIVNEEDKPLLDLVKEYKHPESHYLHTFRTPSYQIKDGQFFVKIAGEKVGVSVFGKHNMSNIEAAWQVCQLLAIKPDQFRSAIAGFKGAGIRLEIIRETEGKIIIRDYAHAPEKVLASVHATREKYPKVSLTACLELHTFSSLNPDFLPRYKNSLNQADRQIVYVNQDVWERKRMEPFSEEVVKKAFGDPKVQFVQSEEQLVSALSGGGVKLMMSSGNFSNLDLSAI